MLSKAPATFRALKGLFSRVMSDVPHQSALFPEATGAVRTHVRLFVAMSAVVDLQSILEHERQWFKDNNVKPKDCVCILFLHNDLTLVL